MHAKLSTVISALCAVTMIASSASAQLPQMRLFAVHPMGGKAGTTFDLQITNAADDDDAHKLIFSHPGITAKPKLADAGVIYKDPRPIPRQFEVAIAGDVPPGVYEVRAAGVYGLSNPRAFVVSDTDEMLDPGNNQSLDKAVALPLNTALNARIDQRSYDYWKVSLKQGQRVLIACAAGDIDSRMTPVVTIYNPQGVELKHSRPVPGQDPLLDFTAPADGEYPISVYDLLYEGGADYFYRLSASTRPYIDFIEPPAAPPGKATVTLYGRNLPGGSGTDITAADGAKLEKLQVTIDVPEDASQQPAIDGAVEPAEAGVEAIVYQLASDRGASNPVRFYIATAPVKMESEPNDDPAEANAVELPLEFIGRFGPKRDRDWVRFNAKKDQKISINVFSHRLGQPTDPALLVQKVTRNDKGEEQVSDVQTEDDSFPNLGDGRFDTSSGDPAVTFTAPEDATYRVLLRNQQYALRADPRLQYRLVIRSGDNPAPGDFRLVAVPLGYVKDANKPQEAEPGAAMLRRGDVTLMDVIAFRKGSFTGDIEVSVEGLPPGVTADPLTIPAGLSSAPLTLRAAADAGAWAGLITVHGKAQADGKDLARRAVGASLVWHGQQNVSDPRARLTTGLALAVTEVETMPFSVNIGGDRIIETCRAGKIELPVKVEKRDGFDEKVDIEAYDIPRNTIQPKNMNVAKGQSEGKYELNVPNNCPVQAFVVPLRGKAQIEYRKNPAAVAAAEALEKELKETVKALEEQSKQAAEAHKAAEAEHNKANDEFKKAKAEEQEQLRAKVDEAQKKKEQAEQEAKAAADMVKKAQEELKKVENEVKKIQNDSKPKKVNVTVPAGAVLVKVYAGPVFIEVAAVTVKQGGQVEATVKVTRRFGYDEKCEIELNAARGVGGVGLAAKVELDKGQNEAKVTIKAADNAPAGKHTFEIRIRPKFNGQTLTVEQPFELTIEKGEEKK